MKARPVEIQFPLKGLNESMAFVRQVGGQDGTHTTAKCENVVGFDPATGRNRGASRAGTRKYCPDRISGASAGQCLIHVFGNVEIKNRDTGANSTPPSEVRVTATGVARDLGPSTPIVTGAKVTTLVGVSDGTVALITSSGITAISSGTAAMSSTRTSIFAASLFTDIYFCDGANYKYYDVSANVLVTWTATTGGTMPENGGGSRCSLIATWGGRILLSGLETDPNNIFMSAVGDPFDFDYSPATQTVQQAVAGSFTAGYGKNPDIVTALIPYTDDVLLIGGSHSIRKQVGNPSEGGVNVSVTDITGIAYGSAWCQSPDGIIYFFGSRGGVYKIEPEGGVPLRLTAMTIDERLADLNIDENVVTLEWDDRAIAVRVYITPINGAAATHYVWDVRNEAWWPFSYTNSAHNPMAIRLLSGSSASERRILEYGQDGYIRMVDMDATSDDGKPISSVVYIGPFSGMMFTEIYATLSENSSNVTWAICSASSMERALTIAPRKTGRFAGGRNACQWPRTFVERGYLRLSSTGPWAMEQITVVVDKMSEIMDRTMRSTP